MRSNRLVALLSAFLMVVTGTVGADPPTLGLSSLSGPYYISCACDSTLDTGAAMHVAGMGKIEFDGHGGVTITQQSVYLEIGGELTRMVQAGKLPDGSAARFTGFYKVNTDGFGQIFGGSYPPEDNPDTPTFMVTKKEWYQATELYLVLPLTFINPGAEPYTLIHVTASQRP